MKKKSLTLVIIITVSFLSAQSDYQPYYTLTTQAYCAMADSNYQQAVSLYEKAFANYYPFKDDIANLRDCYLSIGDTVQAFDCVKRMIASGWQLKESMPVINYECFGENKIGAFNSTLIQEIRNIYPSLRQDYLKNINYEGNAYLERIVYNEIFCMDLRAHYYDRKKYKFV